VRINPPEAALDPRWTWWIAEDEADDCTCDDHWTPNHASWCQITPIYADVAIKHRYNNWMDMFWDIPPVGRY
jgi:hypothetical protein